MKVLVVGPIAPTGYGVVASHLVWAMSKLADVALRPIGPMDASWFSKKVREACQIAEYAGRKGTFRPDYTLGVWHEWDHPQAPEQPYIAMPTFELDRVRPEAIVSLGKCHRVLVSSRWCEQILKSQLDNVHMEHFHGVDRDIFNEKGLRRPSSRDPFRILNIGKLEFRKGHDIVIQTLAFLLSHNFDVHLWTMWTNPFLRPQMHHDMLEGWVADAAAENGIEASDIRDHIFQVGFKKTPEEVAAIIKVCHYGLYPYRAEGWNLPLLETMSCGLPVGATDVTGPGDYLHGGNAYLFGGVVTDAHDGIWFGQGRAVGNWFTPSRSSIVDSLSKAINAFQLGKLAPNEEGIKTAQEFTWHRAAERVVGWLGQGCPLS